MPRSSRHKSSHKSQRRSSPVDWSGSDEDRESEARVSRDPESEKRKSSHSKEFKESNNGYALNDHGKKRKVRIEAKDESGASDRWDSGLGKNGADDALVEKRSKGDVYSTVDIEKERDKEKYLKDESKSRSSRRHDERSEEKRRYKEEKEREREKEKVREKESDRDREKEREKDRDRERSRRREKYEEDKREKERYEGDRRDKEMYEEDKREKERHLDDRKEKHRYEEVKREKDRYEEDKGEKGRHDDAVASRKKESEISRIEDGSIANKDVDIITENDPTEREQREKHSKRRRDEISPEVKDKEREKEKDREKEKERHRDDHSKSRSTKEHKSEPDKYKDKHRDRDREDHREREYYEYKSSREGNRSSESRYKKSKASDADPYDNRDEYPSKHKDGHGSKKSYEATEDRHERDVEKEDVERSRGEYRYGDKEKVKEKEREKEKEKIDSSQGNIRLTSSPGASSYHDRELNRHRSKPLESPKKELLQEDRPRARTSSTGERTPSRLRDEKLNRPRDDAHPLEISSEIASSTPRSDHASPKFAPEKSPSNTSLKYSSGRGGSGSSKYRERDRDRDRERDSDVQTPDKPMMLKREPTPVGTFNRSNSISNYPPLPYEDGDNRRDSGNDRRFHKRGGALGNSNWNGHPNWASQVNNGFMPLPGPPPSGFHHFGAPPPPLFGIRPPPLKLGPSGVGVPFSMHDPMERFSGHMRGPYGWHNGGGNNPLVEDSFPPNLWGPAGNGMFGAEPFWDQNRPLPSWKSQGEVPSKELINVSQKEIGAIAPAIKIEEHSINENLPIESVEIKDENVKGVSSVETSMKDLIQQKVVQEVDNTQEANVKVGNFWESYLPRACISHNLVDLDILKKRSSAVGELEIFNGVSNVPQVDVMDDGKGKRNGMSIIVLKSLFPTSKDGIFEKAMSLYNKLSNRQKPEKNNVLLGAPVLKECDVHNQAEEDNMHVEAATDNILPEDVTPNLGNDMEVDKKVSSNFVSDTDSIIFKNAEECEQVMKESSEDGLSRIPISTESTH